MTLNDLEAYLVRYARQESVERVIKVDDLRDAQGIRFLCPSCFAKNSGPIGTHQIEVSFAGRSVTDGQGSHDRVGRPVRWNVAGSGIQDITLSPSVQIDRDEGCVGWHGFVSNGAIA